MLCGNQPVSQLIFASTASEIEPSTPSTRRVPRFLPRESGRISLSRHRGHVFGPNSDTIPERYTLQHRESNTSLRPRHTKN